MARIWFEPSPHATALKPNGFSNNKYQIGNPYTRQSIYYIVYKLIRQFILSQNTKRKSSDEHKFSSRWEVAIKTVKVSQDATSASASSASGTCSTSASNVQSSETDASVTFEGARRDLVSSNFLYYPYQFSGRLGLIKSAKAVVFLLHKLGSKIS